MKKVSNRLTAGAALILGLCLAVAPGINAAESDLSSTITGPATVAPGEMPLITVNYANAGPEDAGSAIVDVFVPFGLPVPWDDFTQEMYDALQESAATYDMDGNLLTTTDTNGNNPILFIDDNYCEHFKFQLQGADDTYIAGVEVGGSGSFTFTPEIPMENLRLGAVEILEPADVAQVYLPAVVSNHITYAAQNHRYTRGGRAEGDLTDNCDDLTMLMGPRISNIEPIEAELELVNDGSDDPTYGCVDFVDFTEGNIAFIQRGSCEFGTKLYNAELAGASAAILMNSDLCSDYDNPDCAINMGSGDLGLLATIPVAMLSLNSAQPILDALNAGTPVRVRMGPQSESIYFDSQAWLHQVTDSDPDESNDSGSLIIEAGGTPPVTDTMYFIPAAALAAGAAGSFYQTDVDINNANDAEMTYRFQWLPRDGDNADPVTSDDYTLAAGASMRYENVLETVFGLAADVAGGIAVIADTDMAKIMTRTYNVADEGTFGQAIPAIAAADLTMEGETERINFMSQDDALRANLGCINGTAANVDISIALYDAAGTMLGSESMSLAAYSNDQINRIFRDYAPVNGYADVSSATAGAAYYCYGSVLDNATSDPTTVLPAAYGMSNMIYVPAAALASGSAGSFYQTDVDVNNAGSGMATYQFAWLPRGADNSMPTMSEAYTLEAGASVRYANVLEGVFGFEPNQAGALYLTTDVTDLGVMTRTYNVADTGTFGQAIPGVNLDGFMGEGDTGRIIFMSENDDLRANLGCVNGTASELQVAINLYGADGVMLTTKYMTLVPNSNDQINKIFRDYAPINGYADVMSSTAGASFYCYGSVLDNATSDPTTILPQ